MSLVPSNPIAQSIAQVAGTDRSVARPGDRKQVGEAKARRRDDDAFESVTGAIDPAQAVRNLKGNEEEETREDREQRDPAAPNARRSIDVRG